MNNDKIIQKCIAIAGWTTRRGRAVLQGNESECARASIIVDKLIKELEELLKKNE